MTQTTTTSNLFDFYTAGVCLPKLEDGKHRAKLISDSIQQKEGYTYVLLTWQLEDRTVTDPRSEAGFRILISQARDVLGITAPTPVPEILKMLRNTEVDLYVQHVSLPTKQVTNYSLRPFLTNPTPTAGDADTQPLFN